MKAAFSSFLSHANERGGFRVENPVLAAEQFAALCRGIGDVDQRFGLEVSSSDRARRISGAVDVLLVAYAA
jgi:TetR/AcrR family transcriptional repressor of mexJK operon